MRKIMVILTLCFLLCVPGAQGATSMVGLWSGTGTGLMASGAPITLDIGMYVAGTSGTNLFYGWMSLLITLDGGPPTEVNFLPYSGVYNAKTPANLTYITTNWTSFVGPLYITGKVKGKAIEGVFQGVTQDGQSGFTGTFKLTKQVE